MPRTQLPARLDAAEHLSRGLVMLQQDHGLSFADSVETLLDALHHAYGDEDMPGGGYIVVP